MNSRNARRVGKINSLALFSILAAVAAGFIFGACFGKGHLPTAEPRPVVAEESVRTLPAAERQVVDIFREASKSVVFISNNTVVRRGPYLRSVQEVPQGTGSGFVWDKQGHVITNYHVVRGASSIRVTLGDKSYQAKRVGVFVDKELAVLKIDAPADQLYPIRIGRSNDLEVGMTALAIGNPFGLDHTLTVGVISALDREIQAMSGRQIADVIQTDAAINPGNSGGPLLNSAGELIGMNTAILSPSGVSAGIGFAVPVDIIRRYADQIIKNGGKVQGAGLGIGTMSDSWTKFYRIKGAMVQYVAPRSAAEKAGLRGVSVTPAGEIEQLGDIITAVNGKEVTDLNSLRDALERFAVGDEVEVSYVRDNAARKAKTKLQQIDLPGEIEDE